MHHNQGDLWKKRLNKSTVPKKKSVMAWGGGLGGRHREQKADKSHRQAQTSKESELKVEKDIKISNPSTNDVYNLLRKDSTFNGSITFPKVDHFETERSNT